MPVIRPGFPDPFPGAVRTPGGGPPGRTGRGRLALHAALFLATVLTTAFAPHVLEALEGEWSSPADLLRPDWTYSFWVLLILGSHEMGHYLACRYYRIPATLPFFIPGVPPIGTFGAVIRIRGMIPHRKALFDVAAAGPIAGFVIALPAFLVGLATAQPTEITGGTYVLGPPLLALALQSVLFPEAVEVGPMMLAGWVGMLVTSLNLFPVGQLDGGHMAYALSRRLHRIVARTTLVALLVLIALQSLVAFPPAYLLWFFVLLWMRDRHPRLLDEVAPVGPVRRVIAVALLLVFLASFIPVPIALFP